MSDSAFGALSGLFGPLQRFFPSIHIPQFATCHSPL